MATSYVVLYKREGETEQVWSLLLAFADTTTIRNLSPFSCYDVMVQAKCEGSEKILNSSFSNLSFRTPFQVMFKDNH